MCRGAIMIFLSAILFWFCGSISALELPAGVKLCHRHDPNFSKCVAENVGDALKYFVDGYKPLGVPAIEPLFIEKLNIEGQPSQSVSVTQKYRNVNIYGMANTKFEKMELELDNDCKWSCITSAPIIRMVADYEIKGQLLVFPINAHGKCNITSVNMRTQHNMTCEKYTKNGETYLRVLHYSLNLTTEAVDLQFDSLFPGNEQISREVSKMLNENSLAIFNEIKEGVEKAFSLIYSTYMNIVFSKIPMNKVYLD